MIRKDDILKMTEKGISVFRYYLPVDFKVGKNFLNPFYKDTKASCNIYYFRCAGTDRDCVHVFFQNTWTRGN